jgi:hypothetical protein
MSLRHVGTLSMFGGSGLAPVEFDPPAKNPLPDWVARSGRHTAADVPASNEFDAIRGEFGLLLGTLHRRAQSAVTFVSASRGEAQQDCWSVFAIPLPRS